MSYTGYSEYIPLYTKLIVTEYANDYEGDSYVAYYENIRLYLSGDMDEETFTKFVENSKFCMYELDHLIKNIDNLLEGNIQYKQKLNKFIENNIDSKDVNNKVITAKALSLLFDDFIDSYSYDIFDYECFYLSIFGVFINLDDEGFMEFISENLKINSVNYDDFYFLISFIKELVDYTYVSKYSREFIIYSEDFLDVIDDTTEHISLLMFLTFRIGKMLQEICDNPEENIYLKDKKFILVVLKLFSIYCNEYNAIFIDQIDEKNKKFLENTNIIYILLKALTEFPITKGDCVIILNVYSKLIFDYVEYASMKKITNIVKYLVSPVLKEEDLRQEFDERTIIDGEQEIINILSYCFIMEYDYVEKFIDKYVSFDYEFDNQICFYILKLILTENIENKTKYFSNFIDGYYVRLLEGLNSKEESLFNYLLWITNDIIKHNINFRGMSKIYPLLVRSNKIGNDRLYEFTKNVVNQLEGDYVYSFEGKSFYKKVLESEKSFYQFRIDREYLYAKYLFVGKFTKEIEDEKKQFLDLFLEYVMNNNSLVNRENYYNCLLKNKYFDIYKFEVLEKLNQYRIDEELLKKECDFLIYNSPHEEGFKFGIILSLNFDTCYYAEVYENIVEKVNWGDIFYVINYKFKLKSTDFKEKIHDSFTFMIKYEMFQFNFLNTIHLNPNIYNETYNKKDIIISKIINSYFSEFSNKLNSYDLTYLIISYYYFENEVSDIDILTLYLKTIVKLINEDENLSILNDNYIYKIFMKYFEVYTKYFISFTQFEVLEEIYTAFENKYKYIDICNKEIESISDDTENQDNFKNKSSDILKNINTKLKSSEADEYYEHIFESENIELLLKILANETKFYNETMKLFYEYLQHGNISTIESIYRKSSENIFVARIFIKILAFNPRILLNTLTDFKKNRIYLKILNCTF